MKNNVLRASHHNRITVLILVNMLTTVGCVWKKSLEVAKVKKHHFWKGIYFWSAILELHFLETGVSLFPPFSLFAFFEDPFVQQLWAFRFLTILLQIRMQMEKVRKVKIVRIIVLFSLLNKNKLKRKICFKILWKTFSQKITGSYVILKFCAKIWFLFSFYLNDRQYFRQCKTLRSLEPMDFSYKK